MRRGILLILVVFAIVATIVALEGMRPQTRRSQAIPTSGTVRPETLTVPPAPSVSPKPVSKAPARTRTPGPLASELAGIAGYINTSSTSSGQAAPITIGSFAGNNVVLVDFWTYSCINCQRTLPYLNAWYDKYHDKGLVIIGVHTPEFQFESEIANVQKAVEKYGIKYPVVLDNDYATWTAYGNHYWPHKYLIDVDGHIAYDHIGEGGYAETETVIQELLAERRDRFGIQERLPQGTVAPANAITPSPGVGSPEIYFGAARNQYLGNGTATAQGSQDLVLPEKYALNALYLGGSWDIQDEYALNASTDARVVFRYRAKDVYWVASAARPVRVRVLRDGKPVGTFSGADVHDGSVTVQQDRLYHIITDTDAREHTLELIIESPGVRAYTFTFG